MGGGGATIRFQLNATMSGTKNTCIKYLDTAIEIPVLL